MILGLTIEHGFMDDMYPTYVSCDFENDNNEYTELWGTTPIN